MLSLIQPQFIDFLLYIYYIMILKICQAQFLNGTSTQIRTGTGKVLSLVSLPIGLQEYGNT